MGLTWSRSTVVGDRSPIVMSSTSSSWGNIPPHIPVELLSLYSGFACIVWASAGLRLTLRSPSLPCWLPPATPIDIVDNMNCDDGWGWECTAVGMYTELVTNMLTELLRTSFLFVILIWCTSAMAASLNWVLQGSWKVPLSPCRGAILTKVALDVMALPRGSWGSQQCRIRIRPCEWQCSCNASYSFYTHN